MGEINIQDVTAFARNGNFDRAKMGELLGMQNYDMDLENVKDVTQIFPQLVQNLQLFDNDIICIPRNTLNFLQCLAYLKIVNMEYFGSEEIIEFIVNHIDFHDPLIGADFVRLLNVLHDANVPIVETAIKYQVFDHIFELFKSLGDGEDPFFENHIDYILDGILVFIEIVIEQIDENTDTEILWNFGISLIDHPIKSSTTIGSGFAILKMLSKSNHRGEVNEEFLDIISSFSNDGRTILEQLFDFLVSYGPDIIIALNETDFFPSLIENLSDNLESAPSILYFFGDVEYRVDEETFNLICQYITQKFSFRLRSASIFYIKYYIQGFNQQQMGSLVNTNILSDTIDIMSCQNTPVVADCVSLLFILVQTWSKSGIKIADICNVDELAETLTSIQSEAPQETDEKIQGILDLL
ncbi:hypothetical protein TVAG_094780 [Trichomonas vaginalis G3]|uniref:Uncharacterized protein n=1 Tax=Trichomonas vaginalis (strain ATCC PRA-98 / G3) TaxID=412133 RepID=A2FWA7_TRIV3|nr:armadillo (ARM) repeat-containing protein family [Trichomonas vaginalis G3]EAX90809.1 hypothetical protein TVAG_094780 [Trichomonas vaginalis G3]KAI5548783.1 armadillo (ARM) repeat-containing protein family [Trichomonas vaginalis G3]|eukprot:XP_001303739.1 hypothetical protein [Trichomonas vaginalis G3]